MPDTKANDYIVARELNLLAIGMILNIYLSDSAGVLVSHEIEELNRAYVLLGKELQKLYKNNPELAAIKPEPIWKRFEVLKHSTKEIVSYISESDDYGGGHLARVEKLCMLADVDTPTYTAEQQKIKDYFDEVLEEYFEKFDEAKKLKHIELENSWYIPEYTLTYKLDGSILVNDVLRLKKAHAGSTTERLLEQSIKTPNTLFRPDLGKTSRNLSTVLSSAGFTATLRDLFFPTVSASKGIVFRPTITREQADTDKIDTTRLDLELKVLGATTKPKS